MKPFHETPLGRLHHGDTRKVMKTLPDESYDVMVSDPPFGLNFMGKDWDKAIPKVEVWKECLRLLKPGAFAFVMSSPRQDVMARMIINLEDAGFITNFSSIYWAYATGFPKALNIEKRILKDIEVELKKKGIENIEWVD